MKISRFFSRSSLYTYGLLTCLFLLGFAVYLQAMNGLQPCPLCVIQRAVVFLLALLFLVGALYTPPKKSMQHLHSISIILFSSLGALAAWRQVVLEKLPPDQVPPCGPSLNALLQNFPLRDVIAHIFAGTPDCAKIAWSWMGLSLPSWTLLFFMIFIGLGLVQTLRK